MPHSPLDYPGDEPVVNATRRRRALAAQLPNADEPVNADIEGAAAVRVNGSLGRGFAARRFRRAARRGFRG